MTDLADREFVPTRSGSPLEGEALDRLASELGGNWDVIEEHHIEREYEFENFQRALDFVNRVGALAEELDHHPDLCFGWGYVEVAIWNHAIEGLSEGDFIFAARVDRLYQGS